MKTRSIFSDFVRRLGVPATDSYSDSAYATMPFSSLFGFGRLLQSYGIPSEAYRLNDKSEIHAITPPYLAQYRDSFVVVDAADASGFTLSDGERSARVSEDDFMKKFGGVVLVAYPDAKSSEPDYRVHRFTEIARSARQWVLWLAVVFVAAWLVIANGLWRSWSVMALAAIDSLGLYASYLLVLKSSGIKTKVGDRICGAIERTGCHTVLGTSASKFFGIFGWSEVGVAYFGVSLLVLLLFPQCAGWLALINAVCCPFSIWSVWYQKYRAKAWCTLCLTVQTCLWTGLLVYIAGGWFRHINLSAGILPLLASYVVVLLISNAIAEALEQKNKES